MSVSGLLIVSVYAHFVTAGSFLLLSVCERTSSGQFSVQCLCLGCLLSVCTRTSSLRVHSCCCQCVSALCQGSSVFSVCLSCSLPSYSVSAIYFLASFRQLFLVIMCLCSSCLQQLSVLTMSSVNNITNTNSTTHNTSVSFESNFFLICCVVMFKFAVVECPNCGSLTDSTTSNSSFNCKF